MFDLPINFQYKFDYIIDRLAKTNLLSIMINIGMEDQLKTIIHLLIKIQGDKKYPEQHSNFNNIFLIIKGILDEVRNINIHFLNDILINFNKKLNKEKYALSYQILNKMKNILSAPVNQLIFELVKNDNLERNYTSSTPEILKIKNENFNLLIKNLCKISHEYLINFLISVPLNKDSFKSKILGCTFIDILNSIFSSKNSVYVASDYTQIFSHFVDILSNNKQARENDRYKVFRSLIKFLYKNPKNELKKKDIYFPLIKRLQKFCEELKSETLCLQIIDFIKSKIFKNKKIPTKILSTIQCFLDHKNFEILKNLVEFNFLIIEKKIINVTNFMDFISTEKKKKMTKLAFLFNNLLLKSDESVVGIRIKKIFEEKMFLLFNNFDNLQNNNTISVYKSKTILVLFYLTLTNHKSQSFLHNFFMECLDVYYVFLDIYNKSNQEENEQLELKVQNSKKKISDKNCTNLLISFEEICNSNNFKDKLDKLFTVNADNIERMQMLDEILTELQNKQCSLEEKLLFKKAFIVTFENNEMSVFTDFGNNLLQNLDESNKEYDLLQTILCCIFYHVRMNVSYLQIKLFTHDFDKSPIMKYHIDEWLLEEFKMVIKFIQQILISKITQKDIMAYIFLIIRNFFELKNSLIIEKIINFVMNDFTIFCFNNNEISIKSLAVLYYDINKTSKEILFPECFEFLIFDAEKGISAICFINEYLKLDRHNEAFNNFVFKNEIQIYLCETLKEQNENNFNTRFKVKNLQKELESETNLNLMKIDLANKIKLKHEILKYEFYLQFMSENETDLKTEHHNRFLKNIFQKIYELSNSLSDSEEEQEKSKNSVKIANKLIMQVTNLDICKYINLILKHLENGLHLKPKYGIKITNLALSNELIIRSHLLKKLEKCFKKNHHNYFLQVIPISMLYFNDPDKNLKKRATILFSNFINYIHKKFISNYEKFKNEEKKEIKYPILRYLPEIYISFLIMYFVFNTNLNLLFQSKDKKFFEIIITTYLRLLKKNTLNELDSDYIIKNIHKIKNSNLKGKEVIKKFSYNTYIKSLIKKDNYSITDENYEEVKNEICEMIVKIINNDFTSNFKYEGLVVYTPLIFSSDKDMSLVLSNIKSYKKDESVNRTIVNNFSNISGLSGMNTTNNFMNNLNLNDTTFNTATSNIAVKDLTLKLDFVIIFI